MVTLAVVEVVFEHELVAWSGMESREMVEAGSTELLWMLCMGAELR